MNRNGKHRAKYGTKEKETKKFFGRISFRTFALSLVALIQIALLLVGATYSWVETISSIKFDGATGKIGTGVKKIVNLTDAGGEVYLDNYFEQVGGGTHLAACSSADGENFYFPIIGETNKYRKGTINDKNVNYVDFDFEIKNTTKTEKEYTFNKVPNVEDYVRVAIYLDGDNNKPQIFAKKASTTTGVVSDPNGNTTNQIVKSFADYKYGNTYGNSIFKVSPDCEVKVKVKIWLQEGGSSTSNTVSINDLALICGESHKTVTVKYGKDCDSSMGDIYLNNKKELSKVFCDKDSTVTLCSDANTNSTDIAPYGYKFMGWYNDYKCTDPATDLNQNNQFTMKDRSKEFYAKFKKICKITLHAVDCAENNCNASNKKAGAARIAGTTDDKYIVTPSSSEYAVGETITIRAKSIDPGHEFVGWYSSEDFSSINNLVGTAADLSVKLPEDADSVDYYAQFKPKTVTISAIAYKNSDNKFFGKVTDGRKTDTVVNVKTNYDGSSVTFSPVESEEGYVFDGWFSDSECTTELANDEYFTYTIDKDNSCKVTIKKKYKEQANVYAKFRLKRYTVNVYAESYYEKKEITDSKYGTVTYTYNGTDGPASALKQENIVVEYGKKITLQAIDSNNYCEFDGWYTKDSDGKYVEVKDADNKHIKSVDYLPVLKGADNTTYNFYAKFNIKSKTVSVKVPTLYNQYGTVHIGDDTGVTSGTYKYGDNITLKAVPTENEYNKYKFSGWYDNDTCVGEAIREAGTNYTFTVDNNTKDNYYAKFEIKTKKISVNCKNDTVDTTSSVKIMLDNEDNGASGTFNYGETIKLVATPGSNYKVEAWYTDANCSQKVSSSDGMPELSLTVGDSTSETYYVKLVKKAKSISVSCKPDNQFGTSTAVINNGTAPGTTTSSCEYGSKITLVATPDDEHTFVGWYSDSSCEGSPISTSTEFSLTVGSSADVANTYYAKFEEEKTITVHIKNYPNDWSKVCAYMWVDGNNNGWPGVEMTKNTATNEYEAKIVLSHNYKKIIFNKGNNDDHSQSPDLDIPSEDSKEICYDYGTGKWCEHG